MRHLFAGEHLEFVLNAMIAGNTPARMWTDDPAAPGTALIWDGVHSVYLAGTIDRPELWRRLFDREIASAAPGLLKLYVPEAAIGTVFAGHPLRRRERVLYRAGRPAFTDRPRRMPAEFSVSPIHERFAELRPLANFSAVVEEIESC